MPEGVKRLEVRASTLVGGPSLITEPGTRDVMPRAGSPDTADTMPQPRFADQSPLNRGNAVVSSTEHMSWKALQDSGPSGGNPSGPGAGITEMGEPRHMPGVVQKNKAPF